MKMTIDESGRLELPQEIREAAGLRPGMTVEVRCQNGHIEISEASTEAEYLPIRVERRGHLVVAVPEIDVPTLTAEMVEQVREQVLRERGINSDP